MGEIYEASVSLAMTIFELFTRAPLTRANDRLTCDEPRT